ncbi:MAG: hypothetical protein PHO37_00505 [Kiritimatiellae bacterium]|nr:hypothetical protein [Kiritimatiellia bacterium]
MNLKQLTLVAALAAVGCAAAQDTNSVAAAEAAAIKAKEDRIMERLNTGSDPFRFETGGSGKGVAGTAIVGMDASKISASVAVKGIIVIEGSQPRAMIKVGSDTVQIVSKDDLIMLPQPASVNKQGKTGSALGNVKYLLVKEISKDGLTVAPEQHPQELIKIW